MSILGYISTQGTNLAFTPNSAVNSVPVSLGAPEAFRNPLGRPYFERGETIKLHHIFVALPYQWGLGELGPLELTFYWRDRLGNNGTLSPPFDLGDVHVPDVNIIFPLDVVLDTPPTVALQDDWLIEIEAISGWAVNMINSPVALDAIVQYPRVFLFVEYNFSMQV